MWATSSKGIGSRSALLWLFSFCWLLIPSVTCWPQDSPPSEPRSDFLQAVKDLSASLTPDQKSKLTLILTYYDGVLKTDQERWDRQLATQKRLSELWQAEKAKILNDQIWGDLWSFIGGAVGGYAGAKLSR